MLVNDRSRGSRIRYNITAVAMGAAAGAAGALLTVGVLSLIDDDSDQYGHETGVVSCAQYPLEEECASR